MRRVKTSEEERENYDAEVVKKHGRVEVFLTERGLLEAEDGDRLVLKKNLDDDD